MTSAGRRNSPPAETLDATGHSRCGSVELALSCDRDQSTRDEMRLARYGVRSRGQSPVPAAALDEHEQSLRPIGDCPVDRNGAVGVFAQTSPSGTFSRSLLSFDRSSDRPVDGKGVEFDGFPAVSDAVIGTVEACRHRPKRARHGPRRWLPPAAAKQPPRSRDWRQAGSPANVQVSPWGIGSGFAATGSNPAVGPRGSLSADHVTAGSSRTARSSTVSAGPPARRTPNAARQLVCCAR